MRLRVPDHIASMVPYPPGKPLEELEREYGITDSIKLASNENPLGPSPRAMEAVGRALGNMHRYPDSNGYYLRGRLSEKFHLPFEGIVLGHGSDEIIDLLVRTYLVAGDEVLVPTPAFLIYQLAAQATGHATVAVPLNGFRIDLERMAQAVTPATRMIFLTNPNNPTGSIIGRSEFESFLERVPPGVIVAMDEAYIEFVQDATGVASAFDYIGESGPYVVALRTFSKVYGLAGLRIGYGAMDPHLADYLNRVRQPFNTGALSQLAALAAVDDEDFVRRTRETVWNGLRYLYREVSRLQLPYVPSQANFFLIEMPVAAKEIYQALLRRGVIVRPMNAYGMDRHIRVNAGLEAENRRFVQALEDTLRELGHLPPQSK